MAPEGGVHCPMADWSKFAMLHLAGARGEDRLLGAETFRRLHTPAEGFDYAGGWVVRGRDRVLTHDGSNTMWYARVQIHTREDVAFLVATNRGGDDAKAAVGEAVKVLNRYYLDPSRKR
jgi:hypothetical protein